MAAGNTRGLGKGLSALISDNYNANPAAAARVAEEVAHKHNSPAAHESEGEGAPPSRGVDTLVAEQLVPGKYQPRTQFDSNALNELAESIRRNGVMQPIIVRPIGQAGRYEIIAGERRWRAAKMAGLQRVPVIIRELTDKQALELALVENVQRQDLSPLEEAIGYQRLIEEFDYTQEELANVVGKSRSHVTNLLRLLALPDEVKQFLDRGELTMGHARALLNVPDPVALANVIVERGLSVRQAEEVSREVQGNSKRSNSRSQQTGQEVFRAPTHKDPDILALEATLSENLGLRVSIHDRGQSGEIILSYDSLSQLDEILRRLGDGI